MKWNVSFFALGQWCNATVDEARMRDIVDMCIHHGLAFKMESVK